MDILLNCNIFKVSTGVGFRPFVYKLAADFNLKGWVNNTSLGVIVDIEGREEQVLSFIEML